MEVNTRGGSFGGGGYGGGVFDGDESMSGVGDYGSEAYPMGIAGLGGPLYLKTGGQTHELHDAQIIHSASGLGAAPGDVFPWGVYSENTEHLQRNFNLWAGVRGYCRITEDGKLGPTTCGAVKLQTGGAPATCQTLNTPQRCGKEETPSDPKGYIWGVKTTETAIAQHAYNTWARSNGYCAISVDGKLGPGTCGALAVAKGGGEVAGGYVKVPNPPGPCSQGSTVPARCESGKPQPQPPPAEVPPGRTPPPSPPPPVVVAPPVEKGMSTASIVGGLAVAGLLVGAVAWGLKGKKGKR